MTRAKAAARSGSFDVIAGIESTAGNQTFPEFKTQLPYKAQLIARFAQNDYMNRIANTGIAPAQAYVLGELWLEEPLSQVELSRRLEIGKATIGKTLGRLELAGVIERRRTADDKRMIMVHLTRAGHALRKPLSEASRAQNEMLIDRLGAELFENLTAMLTKAINILRADGASGG